MRRVNGIGRSGHLERFNGTIAHLNHPVAQTP
jgi:hypothetical protein